MKITQIEARIEQGDCSEETLELFKSALKRVPKANQCQHCYTTAAAMKPGCLSQALDLIQYGLDYCQTSWVDRMRSHYNKAILFEQNGDYFHALKAYSEALSAVDSDRADSYKAEYASDMMRMEMHVNHFEYTDNLKALYDIAIQADSFHQAFQRNAFYKTIAEIIIFTKQDRKTEAENAYHAAMKMLHPEHTGALTQMLRRKGYLESIGATKEVLAFLKGKEHFYAPKHHC